MKSEFYQQSLENNQIQNFMEICSVGAEMLHAGGQTWRS